MKYRYLNYTLDPLPCIGNYRSSVEKYWEETQYTDISIFESENIEFPQDILIEIGLGQFNWSFPRN